MVDSATFEEAGVVVDSRFVKFGSMAVRTSEIKQVHSSSYRTDGHTARVVWGFVSVMFLIWVVAPLQNAFMIPLLVAFGAFAYWKQTHPKPMRHRVIIGTGSTLGSTVLDTEDEDQASRLRSALEAAMRADSNSDARTGSPWGPSDKGADPNAPAVPERHLHGGQTGEQKASVIHPKSDERVTEVTGARMQYFSCNTCGSEVLWDAKDCAHCGALSRREVAKGWWWFLGASTAGLIILAFSSMPGKPLSKSASVTVPPSERPEPVLLPDLPEYRSELERLSALKAGAERSSSQSMKPEPIGEPGAKPMRWVVNLQFSGCPEAKDWFYFGEQVRAGRYDAELPTECFLLRPGAVVLAPPKGAREVVVHGDHTYERGATEQGVIFWTDGMDNMSLSPL